MSTEAKTKKAKTASGEGKKKVGKKKAAKAAVSKEDMKRLKMMAKAFAYGVQFDMIDLERSTQVMSAVTIVELKAVLNSLLSSEKINATAQGRKAQDWAAAADHLKDADAQLLFNQLENPKKKGSIDLKTFLDNAVQQVKVGAHEKAVTAKDKAEAKRIAKFAALDWTSEDAVITTFPSYVQQQMTMARTKNVEKSILIEDISIQVPFSKSYLLDGAELSIPQRAKMALMGAPGSGKSVLFSSMAAQEIKGWPMHLQVHHMTEIEVTADAESLIDTVVHANEFLTALLQCEAELKDRIAKATDAGVQAKLNANLTFIQTKLRENGAEDAVERASASLRVLGFDEVAQQKSTNSLSGGLRMRVALCAAFFVEADLLLLDEPTNHLDFPSLLWLENRLRSYRKSFVIVCHDREILNNCCSSVTTITEDLGLQLWPMNYDAYESARDKAEKKMAIDVQKFLDKNRNVDAASPLYAQIHRKRTWLNEYNRKVVMRMGQFVFPPPDELIPANEQQGVADLKQENVSIIKVDNVRFSYDPITLPYIFDNPISIDITLSSRMGVMGPNGAGKSTFLKLITGRLNPVSGNIYTNGNARIGYFAQHHSAEMDLNTTPYETMQSTFPDAPKGLLIAHLAKCGVMGTLTDTRMTDLSQGMRSCVGFAKITYVCPHLLIMDEPTNFLDIETVDSLISAANKYKGALLLVSHSRLFLQKCATSYLSIVPGQFLTFETLKACEQATYTFIAELEAGSKVKIGAGALAKHGANAGSGSSSVQENNVSEGMSI